VKGYQRHMLLGVSYITINILKQRFTFIQRVYYSILIIPRAALACGGTVRNIPVGRFLLFITFWSLLVYNPVARRSWHWGDWSHQYGAMDFAGGTAAHITSGTTVLAFNVFYEAEVKGFSRCWSRFWQVCVRRVMKPLVILGLRRIPRPRKIESDSTESEDYNREIQSSNGHADPEAGVTPLTGEQLARLGLGLDPEADKPPHNVINMLLGTALLWVGSFGFNSGSAVGGNLRTISACVSTHVVACSGGITSLFFYWIWNALARVVVAAYGEEGDEIPSISAIHLCDGVVISLVAITPAAGYVSPFSTISPYSKLTIARCRFGVLVYLGSCQQSLLIF
jgi:Amt family ammonium transporter